MIRLPEAPTQLTSAVASGAHSVVLTWTDASDPVSFYLLSYGLSSGKYIYGNPNIGGQGTTSYTVGGLATGTRYYFVVQAVNGCMPGSFSNELSAVAGGVPTATAAPVDTSSDTGTTTQTDLTPTDTPADTPVPSVTPTITPSASSGNLPVGTIVLAGTVVGILLLVGVGVWRLGVWDRITRRRVRRPPLPPTMGV